MTLVDAPNWSCRSALVLAPGRWRMRGGSLCEITKRLELQYQGPFNGTRSFPVWKGRCLCCGTPHTWNINGTYAAVGKHDFDIVGQA